MSLPGKLTIGFLVEDNPVKGYFELSPLITIDQNEACAVEDVTAQFPDDGYIRIVPDKNELTLFKNRMRAIGRACALDLRKFPGENEKIRSNKHYGLSAERNAMIVYSDAVSAVPDDVVMEVLDAQYVFVDEEVTLRAPRPATQLVLMLRDQTVSGPWVWRDAKDVAGCVTLKRAPGYEFASAGEDEVARQLAVLTCPDGSKLMLIINPACFRVAVEGAPDDEPEEEPTVERDMADDDQTGEPVEAAPAAGIRLDVPPPVKTVHTFEAHPQAEPARAPEPPRVPVTPLAPETDPGSPKPWLTKTEMPQLRAIGSRMSLRDQALAAQSGINPRRGRSLSEVIDEQWRKSRAEQLGHPVPLNATGQPVLSPIDRVEQAVSDAWKLPEARSGVLSALLSDDSLRQALAESLKLTLNRERDASDAFAREIEAERLMLLTQIDALREQRDDVKEALMLELRKAHRDELKGYEEKNQALEAECRRNEEAAERARKAAEAAEALLSTTAEQLEQHMLNHLMTRRATELALRLSGHTPGPVRRPRLYEPTANALFSDLRAQLESAGFTLSQDDVICLLAAMMTGGMVVISGAPGSGKSQLVRQLAAALGLSAENGRFAEARTPDDPAAQKLVAAADELTGSILMFDDINVGGGEAMNAAVRLQEQAHAKGLPLCLMLTVQDAPDGLPLTPRLLSRAFLIRLDPATGARWKPPELNETASDRAVALSAIRAALAPQGELAGEVEDRLARLREQLEKRGYVIDRRTLGELWLFCASVLKAGRIGGLEALDRALMHRALPHMLASMDMEQLMALPELMGDLKRCMKLMDQPLPLPPLMP